MPNFINNASSSLAPTPFEFAVFSPEENMKKSVADDWSDCSSTCAQVDADEDSSTHHQMVELLASTESFVPSSHSNNKNSNLFDIYQDRFITSDFALAQKQHVSSSAEIHEIVDSEGDVDLTANEGDDVEEERTVAAFYCEEPFYDEDEEVQEILNLSFVSDVATICSNESTSYIAECDGATGGNNNNNTSAFSSSSAAAFDCEDDDIVDIVARTPNSPLLQVLEGHRDTTTTTTTTTASSFSACGNNTNTVNNFSFLETSSCEEGGSSGIYNHTITSTNSGVLPPQGCRVAFPSCTPASISPQLSTIRPALMPTDPTSKYRKLMKIHGTAIAKNVDIAALFAEHELYVVQLRKANVDLIPSPFPFMDEMKAQQHEQFVGGDYAAPAASLSSRHDDDANNNSAADRQQRNFAADSPPVVAKPLAFLPPAPPSMQTYFVISRTCEARHQPFPAHELHTKPGTGDWSSGYGPEYAASIEDGLPSSRNVYDPTSEAFKRFYAVINRWYDGICRMQVIHSPSNSSSSSPAGNPLVALLPPVPQASEYTFDFLGWVMALNMWWDAEVKPWTGSLYTHPLMSFKNNNKHRQRPTTTPRSFAPPPLNPQQQRNHPLHQTTTMIPQSSAHLAANSVLNKNNRAVAAAATGLLPPPLPGKQSLRHAIPAHTIATTTSVPGKPLW